MFPPTCHNFPNRVYSKYYIEHLPPALSTEMSSTANQATEIEGHSLCCSIVRLFMPPSWRTRYQCRLQVLYVLYLTLPYTSMHLNTSIMYLLGATNVLVVADVTRSIQFRFDCPKISFQNVHHLTTIGPLVDMDRKHCVALAFYHFWSVYIVSLQNC